MNLREISEANRNANSRANFWGAKAEGGMRGILIWLVWNVPMGRLAPWVMGLALGSKPRRARAEQKRSGQ